MANTVNKNLYKPDVDETDWGASVNTNFDILDSNYKEVTLPSSIESTVEINIDSGNEIIILGDVGLDGDQVVNINLLQASACAGQTLFIKLTMLFEEGGVVNIIRYVGDSIEGAAANLAATADGSYLVISSDGVDNWWIFSNSGFA